MELAAPPGKAKHPWGGRKLVPDPAEHQAPDCPRAKKPHCPQRPRGFPPRLLVSWTPERGPWRKQGRCRRPHKRDTGSFWPPRPSAAPTCGIPYWSMTCQIYQSSFRDVFRKRKVVTKAYSSGKPCGNTSLEGDREEDSGLSEESGDCQESPGAPWVTKSCQFYLLSVSQIHLLSCLYCPLLRSGPQQDHLQTPPAAASLSPCLGLQVRSPGAHMSL